MENVEEENLALPKNHAAPKSTVENLAEGLSVAVLGPLDDKGHSAGGNVARGCHSRPSLKEIANSANAARRSRQHAHLRQPASDVLWRREGKRSQEVSVPMVGKT